jgi:hypothetical protein
LIDHETVKRLRVRGRTDRDQHDRYAGDSPQISQNPSGDAEPARLRIIDDGSDFGNSLIRSFAILSLT